MKGLLMNELESAIVEMVDKFNGKLLPGDVQAKMAAKGWIPNEVHLSIATLQDNGVLAEDISGFLHFCFPDETPRASLLGVVETMMGQTVAHDPVNSPSHYTRGGIEAIDFIEAKGLGFCLGNVVKYVSRAGFKADAKIQDLEKARWYLNREIDRLKKGDV